MVRHRTALHLALLCSCDKIPASPDSRQQWSPCPERGSGGASPLFANQSLLQSAGHDGARYRAESGPSKPLAHHRRSVILCTRRTVQKVAAIWSTDFVHHLRAAVSFLSLSILIGVAILTELFVSTCFGNQIFVWCCVFMM